MRPRHGRNVWGHPPTGGSQRIPEVSLEGVEGLLRKQASPCEVDSPTDPPKKASDTNKCQVRTYQTFMSVRHTLSGLCQFYRPSRIRLESKLEGSERTLDDCADPTCPPGTEIDFVPSEVAHAQRAMECLNLTRCFDRSKLGATMLNEQAG